MDTTSYTAHPGESSNLGASPPPLLPPCPEPLLPSVGRDDESVWSYTENEDEENPSPPPDTNEDALLGNNMDNGSEDDLLCYPEEDEVEKFVTVKPEETLDVDMDRVVKEEDIETEIPVPMAVSDDMKLMMDKMGRRFRMSYSSYSLLSSHRFLRSDILIAHIAIKRELSSESPSTITRSSASSERESESEHDVSSLKGDQGQGEGDYSESSSSDQEDEEEPKSKLARPRPKQFG
jgi:hypothetical protein